MGSTWPRFKQAWTAENWTEAERLMDIFDRGQVECVAQVLRDGADTHPLVQRLLTGPRLNFDPLKRLRYDSTLQGKVYRPDVLQDLWHDTTLPLDRRLRFVQHQMQTCGEHVFAQPRPFCVDFALPSAADNTALTPEQTQQIQHLETLQYPVLTSDDIFNLYYPKTGYKGEKITILLNMMDLGRVTFTQASFETFYREDDNVGWESKQRVLRRPHTASWRITLPHSANRHSTDYDNFVRPEAALVWQNGYMTYDDALYMLTWVRPYYHENRHDLDLYPKLKLVIWRQHITDVLTRYPENTVLPLPLQHWLLNHPDWMLLAWRRGLMSYSDQIHTFMFFHDLPVFWRLVEQHQRCPLGVFTHHLLKQQFTEWHKLLSELPPKITLPTLDAVDIILLVQAPAHIVVAAVTAGYPVTALQEALLSGHHEAAFVALVRHKLLDLHHPPLLQRMAELGLVHFLQAANAWQPLTDADRHLLLTTATASRLGSNVVAWLQQAEDPPPPPYADPDHATRPPPPPPAYGVST